MTFLYAGDSLFCYLVDGLTGEGVTEMDSIKIAGAGPAGLTAAMNLAKADRRVEVYEKRSDCGKRFHGDIQGLENWSDEVDVLAHLARMNVDVNFDCDPFLKLVITNGQASRISHYDKPLCYLVKRGAQPGSLDQGLKQQALDAGVVIHFNQTIPLDEADIVATGPISRELFAVDKGIVFETDLEDTGVFLVNDAAAYKGYAYLLVTKGYGCMCTVLFENFADLDANFEATRALFADMLQFEIRQPRPVAGVGSFSTRNVFQRGKSLYVGEAAGIQDLMWGFGIKTAVESGYLAAQAVLEAGPYAEAARAHFNSKQKATLVGRFLWELARPGNYAIVVNEKIRSRPQGALNLSFLYNFSLLHRLLYPFALLVMRRRYPHLRL